MDSTRTFSPPSLTAEYAIKQSSKQLKDKLKTLENLILELERNAAWRDGTRIQQEDAVIAAAKRVFVESDKMRIALREKAYNYFEDRYLDGLCMLQPAIDNMNIILTEIQNSKNDPETVKNTIEKNLTKLHQRMAQISKRLETPALKWVGVISMFAGLVTSLFGLFSSNFPLVLSGTMATLFGSSLLNQNKAQRQSAVIKDVGNQFSNQVTNLFAKAPEPMETTPESKDNEIAKEDPLYPVIEPFTPSPGK